jgi:hypothetical protein
VRIGMSGRKVLAAVLVALGIAAGSGGLSLMLWGNAQPATLVASGSIPPPDSVIRPGVPVRPDTLVPAASFAAPVHIDVPAIHLSSGLLGLHLQDDGTLQVPSDPAQAGWWSEGTIPGNPGPAIVVGHIDSLDGPGVFYRLSALHPGDEVLIQRSDGTTVAFVVDALRQYPKNEFPTDLVYGPTSEPTLRLLTCGGDFNRGTGHYVDNVVVFAHLVSTADTSPAPASSSGVIPKSTPVPTPAVSAGTGR